jgi:hypothetical protein
MGEPKGMLPNTRWVAAHLANSYARKLAHLETFEAFQLLKDESSSLRSETIEANCQVAKNEAYLQLK